MITIASGASTPGAKPVALVDPFGQIKTSDWPDKVKSEDELKADVAAEKSYYDSLQPPAWDKFGGMPDSGKKLDLQATGFFMWRRRATSGCSSTPGEIFFPSRGLRPVAGRRLHHRGRARIGLRVAAPGRE